MAKKNNRDTKGRIIEAAWSLFYRCLLYTSDAADE